MHGRWEQRIWEHRGGSDDFHLKVTEELLRGGAFEPDFEEWVGLHLWRWWSVPQRGKDMSRCGILAVIVGRWKAVGVPESWCVL